MIIIPTNIFRFSYQLVKGNIRNNFFNKSCNPSPLYRIINNRKSTIESLSDYPSIRLPGPSERLWIIKIEARIIDRAYFVTERSIVLTKMSHHYLDSTEGRYTQRIIALASLTLTRSRMPRWLFPATGVALLLITHRRKFRNLIGWAWYNILI